MGASLSAADAAEVAGHKNIFSFTARLANGTETPLSTYATGKPILITNVASRCGYTGNGYKDLAFLGERYGKNLHLLGFPCNQFLFQEPGGIGTICEFARDRGAKELVMFDKVNVKGSNAIPLFKYLSINAPEPGPVKWNFEYFLVGADGLVKKRYRTGTRLNSENVLRDIDELLAQSSAADSEANNQASE